MDDISVNWPTRVIFVPKSFLTQTSPFAFTLDVNRFRLRLKALEASPTEGISYPNTHNHNTEVTVAGVNLARVVELINNYTVEFENGPYSVNLAGANTNIGDVSVFNQVRVNSTNSAGLINSQGSGLSEEQDSRIRDLENLMRLMLKYQENRTLINEQDKTLTVFDDDQVTPIRVFDLSDRNGAASIEEIFERKPKV